VRKIINSAGRKLYWAHASVVIISQDIAREGLTPALDLIIRDTEMREEMFVCISKEKTASEVLMQELPLSQNSSDNISRIIDNQSRVGSTTSTRGYQLVGMLGDEGISANLPCLKLIDLLGKKTAQPCGIAVFKADKLVGFLNEDESKFFLFSTDKIENALLTLKENSDSGTDNISLEILNAKTRLKPELIQNKPVMNIEVKLQVSIGEIGTSKDFIKDKDKIKKDVENKLEGEIQAMLKHVQKDYRSDIFGYGERVKANLPSVWKKAQKEKRNVFEELTFRVKTDVLIKNSALLSKNIKIRE
jgi:spore germination protein KC